MTLDIRAAETTLPLRELQIDPELQCRANGVRRETVSEYREAMAAGATFPAVVAFLDIEGRYWLADGFHRCAAAKGAGLTSIAADVRSGNRKDALLFAASANGSHGLRRTNADKRRAVLLVAGACPKWSDRKVAEAVGVSHPFVAAVRREGVVTVTTDGTDGSEPSPPGDPDRLVAQLTKSLDRVVREWPAERRADLEARLLELATAPAALPP